MENIKNFDGMTTEQVKDFIRKNPFEAVEIAKNCERDLNGIIHLFSQVLQDIEHAKKFL
jgi:hypothetical protein